MKKLNVILCAALVALSALSCNKDEKPAAPMTPDQIKEKLADVTVAALNEVNPDYWKAWYQTAEGLAGVIQNAESAQGLDALKADLAALFTHQSGNKIATIIKLSQVTGDLLIENGTLKYTKSTNPLNLSMTYNGKSYKAWMEASGESGEPFQLTEEITMYGTTTVSIYVPGTVAVHVTENSVLYMDVVVNPSVDDVNGNGKLDEDDIIEGSAYVQIPAYKVTIDNLEAKQMSVAGVIELTHNSTSVLTLDGKVEYDIDVAALIDNVVKASTKGNIPITVDDVTINKLSLMGGQAYVVADVDIQDIQGLVDKTYSSESQAKAAAKAVDKSFKAELHFDNNSTVQASFTTLVENTGSGYALVPALAFADGSQPMSLEEFFEGGDTKVWEPVLAKITEYSLKLRK